MGSFAAGQVITVQFPFSDLSASKLRPALVLAEAGRGDWILCQITSKSYGDDRSLPLHAVNFANGSLQLDSFVRPGKLFTAHTSLMASQLGVLHAAIFMAFSVLCAFAPWRLCVKSCLVAAPPRCVLLRLKIRFAVKDWISKNAFAIKSP